MWKRFLPTATGLGLLSVLLITCVKEYSYEGGLFALYTMEGAPADCSPISISGSYITGNPIDTSCYATVIARVTRAGKYTITTTTADAVSFSASGKFTDTGKQVVYLKASGTPAADGSFTITIPGDNGCSFNLVVKKKAPASYMIQGSPADCSTPEILGQYVQYMPVTNTGKIKLTVDVATAGTYTITTDTTAGIYFSGTGFFAATGKQTVTLTATGTPDEAGLLYFGIHADSSQCSLSIPVTPAAPLAVYVLEYGQDSVCTQNAINGTYKAGLALNNTNTISFKLYVTDLGNYSIYTSKVNGILFGTSGTFTQLGEQTIVLTGSGKPAASGIFSYRPRIVGPSPKGGNFCDVTIRVL